MTTVATINSSATGRVNWQPFDCLLRYPALHDSLLYLTAFSPNVSSSIATILAQRVAHLPGTASLLSGMESL